MKAWQLIEKEENWTIGVSARDKNNKQVSPYNKSACKFCAIGAIYKVYNFDANKKFYLLLHNSICPISIWNDTNTHATVVAKLKELDI